MKWGREEEVGRSRQQRNECYFQRGSHWGVGMPDTLGGEWARGGLSAPRSPEGKGVGIPFTMNLKQMRMSCTQSFIFNKTNKWQEYE